MSQHPRGRVGRGVCGCSCFCFRSPLARGGCWSSAWRYSAPWCACSLITTVGEVETGVYGNGLPDITFSGPNVVIFSPSQPGPRQSKNNTRLWGTGELPPRMWICGSDLYDHLHRVSFLFPPVSARCQEASHNIEVTFLIAVQNRSGHFDEFGFHLIQGCVRTASNQICHKRVAQPLRRGWIDRRQIRAMTAST